MRARTAMGFLSLAALVFAAAGAARARTIQGAAAQAGDARALTDYQRQAIRRIQTAAERDAAPAAARLAEVVSKVYANMLADKPDEKLRAALSAQMEKATWALLAIKGQSIHDILRVLTPAQRRLVKAEMQKPGAPVDLSEVVARTFKLDDE